MARDPASGIRLTSHRRTACVSCIKGKQTRKAQPKQDSGVICLNLKGLMTPQEHLKNR
uniref:Ribosomal protein L34 n=1 Tax=Peronospora matthiolae TaxID=2874970 RepID=A0AAV1UCK3_9STRA